MDLDYSNYYNLFHGTTEKFANKILNNHFFQVVERDNHWLGNGIYFFIDDLEKARWWAKQACKRNKSETHKPKVLFLKGYKVKRNQILDLDTEQDRLRILSFLDELNNISFSVNHEDWTETQKRAFFIDIFVNYYKNEKDSIIAVKQTFSGRKLDKYQKLECLGIPNTGVQICIFDQDSIEFESIIAI